MKKKYFFKLLAFFPSILILIIFLAHVARPTLFFQLKPKRVVDETGVIVHIYDGDTFKINFGQAERRLRLLGVNAPEIGDPSEEVDLWARLARRFSIYYLSNKKVNLTFEKEKEDRYGRLLAYVWLNRDILFNELIVREGLARYLETSSLSSRMKVRLEQAEREARKKKRGMWQIEWPPPIKPESAKYYFGELKTVNFSCGQIRVERGYTVIYDQKKQFQVYISRDRRPLFSDLEKLGAGEVISVFGLIENYRHQPQIILFYPRQLRILNRR